MDPRPSIWLTRPEDGKKALIFVDAIDAIEGPLPRKEDEIHSRLMISGAYRFFVETPDDILEMINKIPNAPS